MMITDLCRTNYMPVHAERTMDRNIADLEATKKYEIDQVWDYYESYWGPR